MLEGLKIMLVGFNDKDWRKFFAGLAVFTVSVISFVASWLFNSATALSSIDILINSVVILYLNDLDGKMYETVNHLCPDWVQEVEATEEKIDATLQLSENLERTISSHKTTIEEDNQRISRLETQFVEMFDKTSNNRFSELEKCNEELKKSNKKLEKEMIEVKNKLHQILSNSSNHELQGSNNRISELEKSNIKINESNDKLEQKMEKVENIVLNLLENKSKVLRSIKIISEFEKSNEEIKRFIEELKKK